MKNAILWGSSGAIGNAILRKLNAEGWTTIGVTKDRSKSPQLAKLEFKINYDDIQNIEETAYLFSQEIGEFDL